MKPQIIHTKTVKQNRYGAIKVREIFNDAKINEISAALIELNGVNVEAKNTKCTNFYFVISGRGTFYIDQKSYNVTAGDLVVIPKGVFYHDEGKLIMLAFNYPRFTREQAIFAR